MARRWLSRPIIRWSSGMLASAATVAAVTGVLALATRRRSAAESARLTEEQSALRRVATLVAQAVPPAEVFEAVTREVGLLCGAGLARMERYDADGTVTGVAAWSRVPDQLIVGTRFDLEGLSVARDVRRTGGPVRLDSFAEATGGIAREAHALGIRSSVGCPIVVAGQLWGVIAASTKSDDPFPAGTESQIASFTELVATAVENAEARAVLRRMGDEQAALRRVATLVARGASPAEVFAAVAEEVGHLFGAESTAVVRYETDDAITTVGSWGRSSDDLARALGRRAALGGQNGVASRSAVGAPISVEGQLWGSLAVASSREAGLPTDTEGRLAAFTELVATAIANADAHTKLTRSRARIVATADDTRRRIERDLHDGAQQRLVSLALGLRLTQDRVPAELPELRAGIGQVAEELTEVLDELHEMSRGIHPSILSEGGLGPALRTLARRSAIPVELRVDTESRYPPQVEVATYHVVSEALTNTTKHAGAAQAQVVVEERDDTLRVRVSDKGVGGAEPQRGSGLIGLRDRVEALGGAIDLTSPVGRGTVIHVSLPLDRNAGG